MCDVHQYIFGGPWTLKLLENTTSFILKIFMETIFLRLRGLPAHNTTQKLDKHMFDINFHVLERSYVKCPKISKLDEGMKCFLTKINYRL